MTSNAIGVPKAPILPNLANLWKVSMLLHPGELRLTYRKPPVIGPHSIPHVNAKDPYAIYAPSDSCGAVSAITVRPNTPTTAPDSP